jgi:hypothetical protein
MVVSVVPPGLIELELVTAQTVPDPSPADHELTMSLHPTPGVPEYVTVVVAAPVAVATPYHISMWLPVTDDPPVMTAVDCQVMLLAAMELMVGAPVKRFSTK